MDGATAVFGVCVGAVAAASVYVLWGPDSFFKRKGRCVGLQNLGNTCFVSAVLQALASIPALSSWLAAGGSDGRLKTALRDMLCCLSEDRVGVVSPAPVLHGLAWHGWTLNHQQQDVHELYQLLLSTLSEEMAPCPSLLEGDEGLLKELPPHHTVAYTRSGPITLPPRRQPSPLQGLMTSELVCCHCQQPYPVRCELFDNLSLTLPLHTQECSLQSCLLDYIKSEVVAGVECSRCSQQAGQMVRRTFVKRLQLVRLPVCLCLHLKRTTWLPSGSLYKNPIPVSFPSLLDMGTLIGAHRPRARCYELVAVVEHLGGPLSGHYVTHRRLAAGPGRGQWVQTSDGAVYSSSLREALSVSANAYMLFYCRAEQQ